MKKNGCHLWPNLDVASAKDWVMTHRWSNYTIYAPVRDGESRITSMSSHYVFPITEEMKASTASAQKDLFATMDLPSKTY